MVGYAIARDGSPIYYRTVGQLGAKDSLPLVLSDGIGCDGYVWKYLERDLEPDRLIVHWHYRGHGRTAVKLRVTASICIAFGFCIFCSGARAEGWDSIGPFGALLSNNDVISGQMNALATIRGTRTSCMSAQPKEGCGRHRMAVQAGPR